MPAWRHRRPMKFSEGAFVGVDVVAVRVATRLALGQLWWTPVAVDAGGPARTDQSEVLVALKLDLLVVPDRLDVASVLVLAQLSDQQHAAVCYVARVRAPVWYAFRLVSRRSLPFSVLTEREIAADKSEAVVAFIQCARAVLPMMVADDAVGDETWSTLARSCQADRFC